MVICMLTVIGLLVVVVVSLFLLLFFFFSSRRRHTRCSRDWSSDVCSSDLGKRFGIEPDVVPERVADDLEPGHGICLGSLAGPEIIVPRSPRLKPRLGTAAATLRSGRQSYPRGPASLTAACT